MAALLMPYDFAGSMQLEHPEEQPQFSATSMPFRRAVGHTSNSFLATPMPPE